jgi:hypothetical protein
MSEKILDRVRKLLSLARSENEHEAASAAAHAAELMREHGLSEAELRVSDATKLAEPIATVDVEITAEDKKIIAWKGVLARGVCAANGVKFWWIRGRIQILGRTSAAQAANYTLSWLSREVEQLTEEAWNDWNYEYPLTTARTWKHSFRVGCATRISERLIERAREHPELRTVYEFTGVKKKKRSWDKPRTLVAQSSTALTLVQKDAEEVCDQYAEATKHARNRVGLGSCSSYDGYDAGRARGSTVNLGSGPGLPKPQGRIP